MKYLFLQVSLLIAFALESNNALQHNFAVSQDARKLIAPIGKPYGFLDKGCFGFDVFDFNIEVGHKHKRHSKSQASKAQENLISQLDAGFLLKRFPSESAFSKYEQEFLSNSSHCIYDSFLDSPDEDPIFDDNDDAMYQDEHDVTTAGTDGIFLRVRWANSTWRQSSASIMYSFTKEEAGLYFLFYQVCPKTISIKNAEVRTTFEIDFHYKNTDTLGLESYLTAGEMPLPLVYFYFFMGYLICTIIWVLNIKGIQKGREGCFAQAGEHPVIYPIHQLMSVLLIFKTCTVLFESVRYHYIRITGHAEFWSVVYYAMSFVKSMFLFTVVLLVGSGWSFVKPFLTDREKKIIFFVLLMQVMNNIALVVLSTEEEGETGYEDWSAVLHMVDILCCCAVLVPIVWQVNTLEKSLENKEAEELDAQERSDNERTISKLKLFRSFYLLVIAYIYFTRIAVYLFATILDYRHTWVRYFVTEMATLTFYVCMGMQFRPVSENPYLGVSAQEDEDTEIQEKEVEMGPTSSSKLK